MVKVKVMVIFVVMVMGDSDDDDTMSVIQKHYIRYFEHNNRKCS
jgi:hypothetical protein